MQDKASRKDEPMKLQPILITWMLAILPVFAAVPYLTT
jgi:hypothetical protein